MKVCKDPDSRVPGFVAGHVYEDLNPMGCDRFYIATGPSAGEEMLIGLETGIRYSRLGPFGHDTERFTDVTDKVCLKVVD